MDSVVIKKFGYVCEIAGMNEQNSSEHQEIFLELKKSEAGTSISFFDFVTDKKITTISAKFDKHNLLNFVMKEAQAGLTGESLLLHDEIQSLSPESKVVTGMLRLTVDEDLNGKLERKLILTGEDKALVLTGYEDFAEISNCEKFEAVWID